MRQSYRFLVFLLFSSTGGSIEAEAVLPNTVMVALAAGLTEPKLSRTHERAPSGVRSRDIPPPALRVHEVGLSHDQAYGLRNEGRLTMRRADDVSWRFSLEQGVVVPLC